jgi:hypothetical protein
VGRRLWEEVDGEWKLNIPNANDLLVGVGLKSTDLDEQDERSQTAQVRPSLYP